MLTMSARQLLSLLLIALLVHPSSLVSATASSGPRAVLGSVTSYGSVRVGDVPMPSSGTLFSGDQVQTQLGTAMVQYREGPRVLLTSESLANFSSSEIQLQKGSMSFWAVSESGPTFAASTLRLEPASAKAAADVILEGKKASVLVTEGTVKVVDPSGAQIASLRAGEARLFEEAAAAALPSPAAAPPQAGTGMSSRAWLIALGVALVGTSLGIAGLLRANDADDRADKAQAAATAAQTQADQARTLVTQLQSTNAALQAQVRTLQTQLASISTYLQGEDALLRRLSAAVAELSQLEAELAAIDAQIAPLLAIVAQGGRLTDAQISTLQSLVARQAATNARIRTATNTVVGINNDFGRLPRPITVTAPGG